MMRPIEVFLGFPLFCRHFGCKCENKIGSKIWDRILANSPESAYVDGWSSPANYLEK